MGKSGHGFRMYWSIFVCVHHTVTETGHIQLCESSRYIRDESYLAWDPVEEKHFCIAHIKSEIYF